MRREKTRKSVPEAAFLLAPPGPESTPADGRTTPVDDAPALSTAAVAGEGDNRIARSLEDLQSLRGTIDSLKSDLSSPDVQVAMSIGGKSGDKKKPGSTQQSAASRPDSMNTEPEPGSSDPGSGNRPRSPGERAPGRTEVRLSVLSTARVERSGDEQARIRKRRALRLSVITRSDEPLSPGETEKGPPPRAPEPSGLSLHDVPAMIDQITAVKSGNDGNEG